jgi:hypothetical protein
VGKVCAMTIVELAGGARLALPEEPVELKAGLRDALLEGQDWREGLSDDICIGVWLWGEWQPTLEPAGFSRDEFVDVVTEYRRELWLWLVGDRVWPQFVSGLAGRVARRLPVLASAEPTDTADH